MLRIALASLALSAPALAQDAPALRPLVLTVQHFDGSPASGASVAAVRGEDTVVESGFLDDAGKWTAQLPPEELTLYVVGASWLAGEYELNATDGEALLQLPGEGGWISGTIDERGRAPKSPLRITLYPAALRSLGLPSKVRRHFSKISSSISQMARKDGTFRFSGVPDEWSGEVRVPAASRLKSGGISVEVSGPTEDVRLELKYEIAITGLVVERDTRAPLRDIRVSWNIELAGGNSVNLNGQTMSLGSSFSSDSGSTATDADGSFKIGLSKFDSVNLNGQEFDVLKDLAGGIARSVVLQIWNGRDFNLIEYRADNVDISDGYHFEMDFLDGEDMRLLIVDQDGEPIEGAVVRAGLEGRIESEPSDATGMVELIAVSPELTRVQVGAKGYQEMPFDLPDQASEIGRVVLPKACSITLKTLGPNGQPQGRVRVEVTVIDGGIFRGMDGINMGVEQRKAMKGSMRGGSSSYSSTGSRCTMSLQSDKDGIVYLPDVSCDLEMIAGLAGSKTGEPRWKEEFTLVAGEQKVIEIPHID